MQNSKKSGGNNERPNRSGSGNGQPSRSGGNGQPSRGGSSGQPSRSGGSGQPSRGGGNITRRDRPNQGRQPGKTVPAVQPQSPSRSTLIEGPIKVISDKANAVPPVSLRLPQRKYGIVFFETLAAAKNDLIRLQEMARGYDQLNIVIRAEASMDDADLAAIGKVFAGAAWALIHDRRVADGWYNESH